MLRSFLSAFVIRRVRSSKIGHFGRKSEKIWEHSSERRESGTAFFTFHALAARHLMRLPAWEPLGLTGSRAALLMALLGVLTTWAQTSESSMTKVDTVSVRLLLGWNCFSMSSTNPTSPSPSLVGPAVPATTKPLTPSLTPPHQVIAWQAQEDAILEVSLTTQMIMVVCHPTLAPPAQHGRSAHHTCCTRRGVPTLSSW